MSSRSKKKPKRVKGATFSNQGRTIPTTQEILDGTNCFEKVLLNQKHSNTVHIMAHKKHKKKVKLLNGPSFSREHSTLATSEDSRLIQATHGKVAETSVNVKLHAMKMEFKQQTFLMLQAMFAEQTKLVANLDLKTERQAKQIIALKTELRSLKSEVATAADAMIELQQTFQVLRSLEEGDLHLARDYVLRMDARKHNICK